MVDEGLALSGLWWDTELLDEHLLGELPVFFGVERLVETQDGSRAPQTVPSEVQFVQSVQVHHVEFDRWSVWWLRDPEVEVLVLTALEEHDVVTVVELGNLVQFVKRLLRVELRLLSRVGEKRLQIRDQVSVTVRYASRRDEQHPLSVDSLLFDLIGVRLGAGVLWLAERFENGGHRAVCVAYAELLLLLLSCAVSSGSCSAHTFHLHLSGKKFLEAEKS